MLPHFFRITTIISLIYLTSLPTLKIQSASGLALKLSNLSSSNAGDEQLVDVYGENQKYPIRQYMNNSLDPCEDFYEYACGGWERMNEAADSNSINSVVLEVNHKVKVLLREIIETDSEDDGDFIAGAKAKIIYDSCMNADVIRRRGIKPLIDLSSLLGGWPILNEDWSSENFDWLKLVAEIKLLGKNELFSIVVDDDPDEMLNAILRFFPVLYESRSDPESQLEEDMLIHFWNISGVPTTRVSDALQSIFKFRAELTNLTDYLGNITDGARELRLTVEELTFVVPDFNWERYLTIIQGENMNKRQEVLIGTLDIYYIHSLLKIIKRTNPETLANFLFWRVMINLWNTFDTGDIQHYADEDDLHQNGNRYGNWNWCIKQIDHVIGDVLSAIYIKKYFNPNIENDIKSIISNLKQAYIEIFDEIEWTNETTKLLVYKKLNAIEFDIGYSKEMISFDELNIGFRDIVVNHDQYFENMIEIMRYSNRKKSLCSDKYFLEWPEQPTVINAYYISLHNRVAIPIAVLQPPYYNVGYPPSVIYSGIGEIISHEIMHAFDTTNRYMISQNGSISQLWHDNSTNTPVDLNCFNEMFSKFSINDSEFEWDLFQEETISDNVAIQAAFKAYKKSVTEAQSDAKFSNYDQYKSDLELTDQQQFFVNYAQNRCQRITPEMVDTFSSYPTKIRIMMALTNTEDFSETFKCSPKTEMNSAQKCAVW